MGSSGYVTLSHAQGLSGCETYVFSIPQVGYRNITAANMPEENHCRLVDSTLGFYKRQFKNESRLQAHGVSAATIIYLMFDTATDSWISEHAWYQMVLEQHAQHTNKRRRVEARDMACVAGALQMNHHRLDLQCCCSFLTRLHRRLFFGLCVRTATRSIA